DEVTIRPALYVTPGMVPGSCHLASMVLGVLLEPTFRPSSLIVLEGLLSGSIRGESLDIKMAEIIDQSILSVLVQRCEKGCQIGRRKLLASPVRLQLTEPAQHAPQFADEAGESILGHPQARRRFAQKRF